MKGWVNVDIAPPADVIADLTKPLPFADDSAGEITMIHVIEHFLPGKEVASVLREVYRVLKPGGELSIEVPNLEAVAEYLYLNIIRYPCEQLSLTWSQHPLYGEVTATTPEMVLRELHKTCYTSSSLRQLLAVHGYLRIRNETPKFHVPDRDLRIVCTK